MKHSRLFTILLIAAGNLMLGLWINYTFAAVPLTASAAQPGTPPPPGAAEATIAAEMTAVARFTLEPEFAALFTPYFAHVIARDIARQNMTATAAATLLPMDRYNAKPSITPSGTPICAPALGVMLLDHDSTALNALLMAQGLQGSSEVKVGYVDHVDGTCDALPLPFITQIDVRVPVLLDLPITREQRGNLLAPVLVAIANYDLPADLRDRDIQLSIVLVTDQGKWYFSPRYHLALQATEQGLTGAALIAYLTEPF